VVCYNEETLRKNKDKNMQLGELKAREKEIRKARVKSLKAKKEKIKEVNFKFADAKISIGKSKIETWVTFFLLSTVVDFLLCYIAFGDTRVSVCEGQISSTIANFCVGWQSLFILTFSIIIVPITFLIGTLEFFQSIQQNTNLKELTQQLQFQEDMNIVSKVLVYSLFILSVQVLIYFKAFDFMPDLMKLPFVVFQTDAMLPIALALLYYAVRQKMVFYSVSKRLFYTVLALNLAAVVLSRGVQAVFQIVSKNIF